MREEGQATIRICVGRFSVLHTMVVGDCRDEGILGLYVLAHGGARIHFASRTVTLKREEVPVKTVDTEILKTMGAP